MQFLSDIAIACRLMAAATSGWITVASEAGARPAEITRMASAFEHDDLAKARQL
jgi:serine/threonine-protein kinase HipA